jgi:hypothetical protein
MGQARSFIETKNFVTGLRTTSKAVIHANWLVISMGLPLFLYEKVSAQNDRPL